MGLRSERLGWNEHRVLEVAELIRAEVGGHQALSLLALWGVSLGSGKDLLLPALGGWDLIGVMSTPGIYVRTNIWPVRL